MNGYAVVDEVGAFAVAEVGGRYFARRPCVGGVMQQVLVEAGVAASHSLNLLITGPSGSGKDYLARLVQSYSAQAGRPFVAVGCSALPEDLLEAELFGVAKGAFSGALARPGLVEVAKDGYLLLDEVGQLPLSLQPKLLRFLETKEFCRLGEKKVRRAQARVVAASSCCLATKVGEGEFRADLFYRLAQAELCLPALRDRQEELEGLIGLFIEQANVELEMEVVGFDREVLVQARGYTWPGNVRELKNKVRLAVLRQQRGELKELL